MDKNEEVLVVRSDIIFKKEKWQGLKKDNLEYYIELIRNHYQFKKREEVENNAFYQQIIPYILFNFEDKYFVYKYLSKAGEQRLINTYQLGIGGHINKIDLEGKDILETALLREWKEEVIYQGNILEKKLIGILNDESRLVEKVHLGLIYIFKGDSPEIFIKENEKMEGSLMDLKTIRKEILKNQGNIWANIILNEYLIYQSI